MNRIKIKYLQGFDCPLNTKVFYSYEEWWNIFYLSSYSINMNSSFIIISKQILIIKNII